MNSPITLETERLILRPLNIADALAVQRLASRREIADTTISIPHPLSEQQARDWITAMSQAAGLGAGVPLAIELRHDNQLIGTIGQRAIDPGQGNASDL